MGNHPSFYRRSASEIAEVLGRFKLSGLTQREFCSGENLCLGTFSNWRKRERLSSAPEFLRVAEPPAAPPAGRIEVALASGHRIFLGAGFDSAAVAELVALLEGGC